MSEVELISYKVYSTSSIDHVALDEATRLTNGEHLLIQGRKTGWISQPNPTFPQEIIIEFNSQYKLKKLQITSHPTLIAMHVEVFAGATRKMKPGTNPAVASWGRIGSVAFKDYGLNPTMMSEQKTIFLSGERAFCLKFVMMKNYYNGERNPFNQIGILAINVWGKPADDEEDEKKRKKHKKESKSRKKRHSSDESDDSDGYGRSKLKSRSKSKKRYSDSDSDIGHVSRILRRGRGGLLWDDSDDDQSKRKKSRSRRRKSTSSESSDSGSDSEFEKLRKKSKKKTQPDEEEKKPKKDGVNSDDEVRALADKQLTRDLQERRALQVMDLPFEHDLNEFHELILLLDDRKYTALKKERYLDARNMKEILDDLKKTERTLNQLAYKRKLAIEQEDYDSAYNLKRQFTDAKRNVLHTAKHLPGFLTELERKRFLEEEGLYDTRRMSKDEGKGDYDGNDEVPRRDPGRTPSPIADVPDDPPPPANRQSRTSNRDPPREGNPYENRGNLDKDNGYINPPNSKEVDAEYAAQQKYRNARLDQLRSEREKNIDRYPDEKTVQKIERMDAAENPELKHVLNWIVTDMQKNNRKHLDPRVQKLMVKHDIFNKAKPPASKDKGYSTKDAADVQKMLEKL